MILPNKIVRLEDSALSLAPLLLQLGKKSIALTDLFDEAADHFESIDQFLLTLDLLFILGKIDVDTSTGVVSYVDHD